MKKVLAIIGGAVLAGAVIAGTFFGVKTIVNNSLTSASVSGVTEAAQQKEMPAETSAAEETAAAVSAVSDTGTRQVTIAQVNPIEPSEAVKAMDMADIVEQVMPCIVSLTNTSVITENGYGSLFDYFYGRGGRGMQPIEYEVQGAGSGVIIKATGDELLIATNNHMVEGTKSIAVTFCDDTTLEAHVKGASPENDIAVISVPVSELSADTLAAIRVARLHTEHDIRPGEYVMVIGNSLNMGQTVTGGIVSAIDRIVDAEEDSSFNGTIQTDAAINGGNSGGALINIHGEVIGINMGKYARTDVEGVCFSIPIYKVIDQLEEFSNARTRVELPEEKQGRLGIYMNTVSDEQAAALNIPQGVIVVGFSDEKMDGYDVALEDSPARAAGIQKNDIITKFDGQTVKDSTVLADLVKYYEAGTVVPVTVQRINNGEYEEKVFRVTLAKRTVTEKEDDAEKDGGEAAAEGQKAEAPEKENAPEDGGEQGEPKDEKGGDPLDMYELFRQYLEQYR